MKVKGFGGCMLTKKGGGMKEFGGGKWRSNMGSGGLANCLALCLQDNCKAVNYAPGTTNCFTH